MALWPCAGSRDAPRTCYRSDVLELAFCAQPVIDVVAVYEPFLREEFVCAHRDLLVRHVEWSEFLGCGLDEARTCWSG